MATPIPPAEAAPGIVGELAIVADDDEIDYEARWEALKVELKIRCDAAKISFEVKSDDEDDGEYVAVKLPGGNDFRTIAISDIDELASFLRSGFESFRFLSSYDAVWSSERGEIEALVRSLNQLNSAFVLRRLTVGISEAGRSPEEELTVTLHEAIGSQGLSVTIGPMSEALASMLGRPNRLRQLTLAVRGAQLTRHDQARALLERLANSLFFQIDVAANIPLALVRERRSAGLARLRAPFTPGQLQFPKFEYDQRAAQLYWYARSAASMPLLQFLAYYQCLEFYFPIYSQLDAQRRVRNVLKNPMFSPHKDTDINDLLGAVRSGTGRAFGDERSQLRATVNECVTAEALRTYLLEDDERKTFLSAKQQLLGIQRLNLGVPEADWRSDVADRIYNIRCKIVHTKHGGSGDEVDLLLPFSKEADSLGFDIQLVQYIARQVLIAASGPLRTE